MATKRRYSYADQKKKRQVLFTILIVFIVLMILFAVLRTYLITNYTVDSVTMEPTIYSGEFIITTPLYKTQENPDSGISPFLSSERGILWSFLPHIPPIRCLLPGWQIFWFHL
ncbi:S26 family signal peptidase [Brucepastera parasyntrophica]|uniref:S26 family signal peptidase n=1 Tax=Brucepastera parasyntrophica TaxID=2880008 RepID=UPI0034E26A75|nr:S26 family signal peptidase [Brucepastera parasyntrophica]